MPELQVKSVTVVLIHKNQAKEVLLVKNEDGGWQRNERDAFIQELTVDDMREIVSFIDRGMFI